MVKHYVKENYYESLKYHLKMSLVSIDDDDDDDGRKRN